MRLLQLWIALAVAAVGCATVRPARGQGGDQYLIVAAELQGVRQNNLYDAVRQLRPSWWTRDVRGGSTPADRGIVLYVDDRNVGSATELRSYPVTFPARVRYMSPTEAQVRFGPANGMRPAIVIETERAERP